MKAPRRQTWSLREQARLLYRESRELSREIQAQERQGATAAGLTAVGAHALRAIEEACGQLTMLDLARELRIRRSTVTRLVDDLEVKGYVRRRPSEEDRRRTLLELRSSGSERLNSHLDSAEQMQMEVLLRLPSTDRQSCLNALKQLRRAVQSWNSAHLSDG